MRYSNLHTHSTFSDGKHSPEENILSAIDKNMISIGFSDHSFTACDTSYCMKQEQYPAYLQEIQRLKKAYSNQIAVYAGLELDYYSTAPAVSVQAKSLGPGLLETTYVTRNSQPLVLSDLANYDYLIASVHYIVKDGICYPIDHSAEQQIDCIQNAFHGDVLAMVQCYFDLLCEHVERVKPTLVGHFDVLTKFGLMPETDERYRAIACQALKRILQTCPYIEVNTGAIARGLKTTPYPNLFLWKTILDEGGEIVLGSDSHHKDNLVFYFDETIQLLRQAGFEHVCMFHGTQFDRIYL